MKSYLCCSTDIVLLVGEGNFSFSRDFLDMNKNGDFPPKNLYSTCYESNADDFSPVKLENMEALKSAGVNVLLNVDATQLSKDSRLTDIKFTKFIFNFPHTGGKMKINLNRELIRLFCEECKHMIVGSDKDFTNLCCSQGGTKYDETRTWEDTWKLVEMCGYADLVLSNVEYFDTTMLKFYSSIGFRSREQHFNTVKGIIHVLKLSLHPELNKYTSWVDMYPDLDIGHLMDMKQTSILTNSIFSCFKCLFIEAVDLSKAPSGKLQLENTFIIRHGFSSSKPQYPPLDPSKIYDYRIFCNPLKTNSFKIHPVEYNYISENLGFKPLCLSFVRDVCSKINETKMIQGVQLINEHQSPNQQYKSYLFRIWYKSYDRPMYRKKVIDIHQNVIGKCLNSMLGVKID
ncbi:hypothetical protein M8J75_016515 [Diaphorina citri]|nr:hypothetical protein M8J75_016515 [Diaphorina citri]